MLNWREQKDCHIHRVRAAGSVFCITVWLVIFGAAASNPSGGADTADASELHSTDAWMMIDGSPPKSGWEFGDTVIFLSMKEGRSGHIVTKEEYLDFDLEFEWKIAKNGNSGIKFMVQHYEDRVLGLEYQIYDDDGTHPVSPKNSTGSLYDLYEPNMSKRLRPVGEWNQSRIVVDGDKIEHWLNGALIVSAMVGSDEWNDRLAQSKFHDVEGFCANRKGRLMLTDHGSEVWYKLTSLKIPATAPESKSSPR
ncbi:3-keto-disaccharide hydrolase [Pirellulaceae bacterium SH449]